MEQRDIESMELPDFGETIACGIAVVVTPMGSLTQLDDNRDEKSKYEFSLEDMGETTCWLYDQVGST